MVCEEQKTTVSPPRMRRHKRRPPAGDGALGRTVERAGDQAGRNHGRVSSRLDPIRSALHMIW